MLVATLHATSIATRPQLAPSNGRNPPSSPNLYTSLPCQKASASVHRRNIISWAITGAILGLNVGDKNAWAAARRPPPPPAEERKDPNVSGVQAKVLASKRRKEAMKQAVAEQRARGKPIQQQ